MNRQRPDMMISPPSGSDLGRRGTPGSSSTAHRAYAGVVPHGEHAPPKWTDTWKVDERYRAICPDGPADPTGKLDPNYEACFLWGQIDKYAAAGVIPESPFVEPSERVDAPARQASDGRWMRSQSTAVRDTQPAQVQLRGGGVAAVDKVHQAAQRGVADASASLPHAETIQRAFGRHDIGGIRAEIGGAARDACADIGADAYATGDRVAFASDPDLHTAAHEAAHIIQQRGGVQLKGGVGRAGDRYEQHADAVADRVVQGKSAEGLLDEVARAGSSSSQTVQRKDKAGEDAKRFLANPLVKTRDKEKGIFVPYGCPVEQTKHNPRCFLEPRRRAEIERRVSGRLGAVQESFGQAVNAIERARLYRMLRVKDSTGWKMIINILFTVASRGLTDKVLKAWEHFKPAHYSAKVLSVARSGTEAEIEAKAQLVAASRQAVVATTMSALGRAARAGAIAKTQGAARKQDQPSTLMDMMELNVSEWRDSIDRGLAGLDHLQLLAVYAHLDPSRHTRARYEREIRGVISRYESQVGAVGSYRTQGLINKAVPGTQKQAVRIRAYGQTRMALCYAPQTAAQAKEHSGMPDVPWKRIVAGNMSSRYVDGDLQRLSELLKRARFIRWIDEDMAPLAAKENKARVGSVLEFNLTASGDADKFHSGRSQLTGEHVQQVARWIEQARRAWIKKRGLPTWAGVGGVATGVSR